MKANMIQISDSDSNTNSTTDDTTDDSSCSSKDTKPQVILPIGFLDPLPPDERALFDKKLSVSGNPLNIPVTNCAPVVGENMNKVNSVKKCRQFWTAGDYDGVKGVAADTVDTGSGVGGIDHLRVHPKFLHSNATSHKWALGAIAELLDNALDEVCNGATYVHLDVIENKKDKSRILLVEDNGGGMSPDIMRHCMSLGYSAKTNKKNTIGQYGNGFKTSTMRLGADVIVFSRCHGKNGGSATQSVGMLSYTFLRTTMKEDIVVPMIDYQKEGRTWKMMARYSADDWKRNLDTLLMWSPYGSEDELFREFDLLKDQGTRVVIYNLWEDDQGQAELDFDTDIYDIQIKGANRDEKKIEMARNYPNSRHFLTYTHSLRSYAAILYLRIPPGFRIILRGRDVEHHNVVNDMMYKQEHVYRPQGTADMIKGQSQAYTNVIIGFVKDAKYHIDVQGFCVYHKNRLIKPFWRVWNAAGSDGRGIIGVLEADFVNPAHDKQGFEHTSVLNRLELRIRDIQKKYWAENCHEIGYAKGIYYSKRKRPLSDQPATDSSPSCQNLNNSDSGDDDKSMQPAVKKIKKISDLTSAADKLYPLPRRNDCNQPPVSQLSSSKTRHEQQPICASNKQPEFFSSFGNDNLDSNAAEEIANLKKENLELKAKLEKVDVVKMVDLMRELQYEKDRNNAIETKYKKAQEKIQELDKEQETLIDIFEEERGRRSKEEERLRTKLKDASKTIDDLLKRLKLLESNPTVSCKIEP